MLNQDDDAQTRPMDEPLKHVRARSATFVEHINALTISIAVAAFFVACVGLAAGLYLRHFEWFARSGSLVTALGVILISRASLLTETMRVAAVDPESGVSPTDPVHYHSTSQPVPDWVQKDLRSRFAVGVAGPVITTVGTIIWGFGDLL